MEKLNILKSLFDILAVTFFHEEYMFIIDVFNHFTSTRRTVRHQKKVRVRGLGLNISYI